MDYEKIQAILNEVKPIVEENKKCRIEKWKNGDFFNIFSILKMETDEVKTHSAFLAELLNPKGSHDKVIFSLMNLLKIYCILII